MVPRFDAAASRTRPDPAANERPGGRRNLAAQRSCVLRKCSGVNLPFRAGKILVSDKRSEERKNKSLPVDSRAFPAGSQLQIFLRPTTGPPFLQKRRHDEFHHEKFRQRER